MFVIEPYIRKFSVFILKLTYLRNVQFQKSPTLWTVLSIHITVAVVKIFLDAFERDQRLVHSLRAKVFDT